MCFVSAFQQNGGGLVLGDRLASFTNRESILDVQLEALRHHHPQTWEQLHRVMAAYYGNMAEAEYQRDRQEAIASKDGGWWLIETPENDLQMDAFATWTALIGHAVSLVMEAAGQAIIGNASAINRGNGNRPLPIASDQSICMNRWVKILHLMLLMSWKDWHFVTLN